jgi:shikimate kinase
LKNIVLIGFMGCGKSSVATTLGAKTGRAVLDTDQLIVARVGRSIPEIFAAEGEVFFRRLETELLIDLQSVDASIIATGGGIVQNQENWPLLQQLGRLYFLDAPWSELKKQIAMGEGRPLAGDGVNWQPVQTLWERRLPLYRQADVTIATAGMTIDAVVEKIFRDKE